MAESLKGIRYSPDHELRIVEAMKIEVVCITIRGRFDSGRRNSVKQKTVQEGGFLSRCPVMSEFKTSEFYGDTHKRIICVCTTFIYLRIKTTRVGIPDLPQIFIQEFTTILTGKVAEQQKLNLVGG